MTPDQWKALSEEEKNVWRARFATERQNQDYARSIDIWYARDVYHVGRGFLLFWLIAGLVGVGLFGLVFLCWGLRI